MDSNQLPGVVLSPCVQTFIELLLNEIAEGNRGPAPDVLRVKKLPCKGQTGTVIDSIQHTRSSKLCPSHSSPSLAWQSSRSEDQRA
jgi:hypothetical protein